MGDEVFYGKILGIDDMVSFEGACEEEVRSSFPVTGILTKVGSKDQTLRPPAGGYEPDEIPLLTAGYNKLDHVGT